MRRAMKTHPRTQRIIDRLPSDEELWAMRHNVTIIGLAREIGLSGHAVGNALNRKGWRKSRAKVPGWTTAPCKCCGKSFPIPGNATERLCKACAGAEKESRPKIDPLVALARKELKRRLPGGDRHASWMALEPCFVRPTRFGVVQAMKVRRGWNVTRHRSAA